MPVEAVFITQPAIDFTTLLGLTHEALGRNIAGAADASHRKLVDAEKFLFCLAALKHEEETITPNLLAHVSYTVLVATDGDLLAILERTSGMPFVQAETMNFHLVLLTGTLAQWRSAVAAGTDRTAPPTVRACFSKILLLFDQAGLTAVWSAYQRRTASDRCGFLLEYDA